VITCPPGWRAIRNREGLHLVPTTAPAFAEIRYRLRHPIEPIEVLMARKLTPPGFVVDAITPPDPLVTDEGEYAALIVVTGRLDGKRVQRDIGMVYGDDYYALLLGVAFDEARFAELTALVRTLIIGDQQMLGAQRRRRFRHVAPAGWHEQRWDFESTWTPAGRSDVSITTLPALPSQGASRRAVQQLVEQSLHAEMIVTGASGPEPASSRHGLAGQRWRLEGLLDDVPCVRDVVILQDDRFIYGARLERRDTSETLGRAELDDVVASIEPIPRPRPMRGDLNGLKHWIE
jgi:hypothetical protein